MQVAECMSRDVKVCSPQDTIGDAARLLKQIDAGSLPVGENDRLIGMITDRDIAVRAVAEGKSPATPVREVMTSDLQYCFEDDDVGAAAEKMSELQVRRLPVISRQKRLVGIISLGDMCKAGDGRAEAALRGIAQPGGLHHH